MMGIFSKMGGGSVDEVENAPMLFGPRINQQFVSCILKVFHEKVNEK
jgi:hypothetical protein